MNDFDDLTLDDLGPDDVLQDDCDDGQPTDDPQLYYPTLEVFVHDYLIGTYRRHIEGRNRNWCPQWWCHAEAIARLEAMWRSFEHLRMDPATGTSVWFINHADPHMADCSTPTDRSSTAPPTAATFPGYSRCRPSDHQPACSSRRRSETHGVPVPAHPDGAPAVPPGCQHPADTHSNDPHS